MTPEELTQVIENLRRCDQDAHHISIYTFDNAISAIEQLTKERDDAQVDQRLIEELWERRTDMTEMKEQIKLLRKERDEARREVCERTAENLSLLGSNARLETLRNEHAARRGWDCYETKEKAQ